MPEKQNYKTISSLSIVTKSIKKTLTDRWYIVPLGL